MVVRGSPSALACSSSEIRPTRRSATSNSLILVDCLALACAMDVGGGGRNIPQPFAGLAACTPNTGVARFTGFRMVLILLKVAPRYTGRSSAEGPLWALSLRAAVTFFDPSVLFLPPVHLQAGRTPHRYGNVAKRIKQYGFGTQPRRHGLSSDRAADHDIRHCDIFFA